ncbi:MAG: response regulator [Rhodobacteraceae bacterium]|nr:MAG: response regulator [Paracoccaceae bacterium]
MASPRDALPSASPDRLMDDRRLDDALSDNERLRQANEALRARMEKHGPFAPPEDAPQRTEPAAEYFSWIRRYVEVALEAAGVALALFTDEGRLLAVNGRLLAMFPDLGGRLSPGLRFEEAVKLIAGARAIDLPDAEARRVWAQARIAARGRAAPPAVAPLTGDRWVEIAERRAGAGAFALAFEDVTESVLARRRDRHARLAGREGVARSVLEHLPIGIGAFDRDTRLAVWNEPFRSLLGLGLSDLVDGMPFAEIARRVAAGGLVRAEECGPRIALWVEAASPRPGLTVEITRRDGAALTAQCRETLDGGFVIALTDVTAERRAAAETNAVKETLEKRVFERTAALVEVNDKLVQEIAERRAIEAEMRRARDAAESANLSKTRFLAAASHDLLQPLNAAKLFVSALNAGALPEKEAAIAKRVESAFASVESLLNALLDISKLDTGHGDRQLSDFPVSRVLDPVAEEFRPLAAAQGLKLVVARSRAVVRSDPHYLRRIVQNLVGNAIKYTLSGGVVVGVRPRGDHLRIEVWDSGVGIPANERRRIFEEFHRIDGANPRAERGMGLGLAIVDRACRMLGHTVDIRSRESEGSVFSVAVPRGDAAAAEARAETPPPLDFADGGRGMIAMLVEDDAAVRAATAALLDRWGVDVLEAGTAEEALALAEQLGMGPDVILIDYHLGAGSTGLDALGRLRAAFGPGIPAILITADRSRAVAAEAQRAGAQVLAKPVAPAKLRSLLHWSRVDRKAR